MRTIYWTLAVSASLLVTSSALQADDCNTCNTCNTGCGTGHGGYGYGGSSWFSWYNDWHRNNAWPEPFVYYDRDAAVAPFAAMVHKGWMLQNTLSEHHFEHESSRLTEAGERKVHWILTQGPHMHRRVFVPRGVSPNVTLTRINSVRDVAGRYLPGEAQPEVYETSIPAPSRGGAAIDATTTRFHETAPAPRLPAPTGDEG